MYLDHQVFQLLLQSWHIFVAAFLKRDRRLVELVVGKFNRVVTGVVLDGVDVFDGLLEAVGLEPLERFGLDCDKIGNVQDVR